MVPGGTSRLTPEGEGITFYLVLSMICLKCHWFTLGHILVLSIKRELCFERFHFTCVRNGEASSQISQGGAGAQPRLSGQGVAVVVSLSPYSTH